MSNEPVKVAPANTVSPPPPGRGATGGDQAPLGAAPSTKPTIEELAADVFRLSQVIKQKEEAAAKAAVAAAPKEIDWTKLTEADVFNMDIPIPIIEQETPEYLTVHLKDQNYVPRWIHVMRERLGPCLSSGYSYITPEDLDMRFPHPLQFDANNHYSFGDVVCLKILKSLYWGLLRRNYAKTMMIHGRATSRQKLRESIQDDERLGEALDKNALQMYTPDEDENKPLKGKTFSKDMFSAV